MPTTGTIGAKQLQFSSDVWDNCQRCWHALNRAISTLVCFSRMQEGHANESSGFSKRIVSHVTGLQQSLQNRTLPITCSCCIEYKFEEIRTE